jgi:hypothetical protein
MLPWLQNRYNALVGSRKTASILSFVLSRSVIRLSIRTAPSEFFVPGSHSDYVLPLV